MAPPRKLGPLAKARLDAAAHPAGDGGPHAVKDFFSRFATRTATAAGSFWAFIVAFAVILAWLVTGPIFHFSDTWQLVINTATTIVTFLMVFLIQHAQNRDTRILHLKLNELIASIEGASDRLIRIESAGEQDLEDMEARMERLSEDVAQEPPSAAHSVEEEPAEPRRERAS